MPDTRELDISWSGGDDGIHIAVVDRRIAAVVYWAQSDRTWRWVAADRPFEHFLVNHAPSRKRGVPITFTAEAVVRAYLAGADPLEASDKKSWIQEQAEGMTDPENGA